MLFTVARVSIIAPNTHHLSIHADDFAMAVCAAVLGEHLLDLQFVFHESLDPLMMIFRRCLISEILTRSSHLSLSLFFMVVKTMKIPSPLDSLISTSAFARATGRSMSIYPQLSGILLKTSSEEVKA